jgi:hypothetical protein
VTDDGRLRLRAEVMASRHALAAMHAATRVPANAHALADLNAFGIGTYGRDATDHLVTENGWELRNAPVIVQDGEIGVTQAAVFDRDFDVLGLERPEIDGFEHQRLCRCLGNPCLDRRLFLLRPADRHRCFLSAVKTALRRSTSSLEYTPF